METSRQYAERKLKDFGGLSGFARVYISNMLYLSSVKTTRDFYSDALKELDLL